MMFLKETEFQKTPIGKIPKDWGTTKLSELSEHITKGTTPTTYGFGYTASGINFIKVESIDERGAFIPENIPHISEEANEAFSRSILHENDILFSIAGALGRVATVTGEILPANTNQALAIIRLKEKNRLSVEYLKYFLIGSQIQNFVRTIAIQSQQANINLEHVRNFTVALPPLGEQRAIAEVLGVVDSVIAKTGEIVAKTERLKKGLMQTLLTRGIGHTEYKQTPIGTIPKDWKIEKIGNVCKVVTGGTPSTKHPEYFGGNIKWLKSGDIKKLYIYDTGEKITQLGVENSNAKIHPANSVAIALSGRGQTRGRTTIIKEPMACSQSVAIMIPNSELLPEYIHYNLSNRYLEIRNLTGHLDRSGLNLSIVSDIGIPIPSLAEQEKMTSILITIDKKLELERDEKAKLERVNWGLMDLLLTGKVRIKVD